MPNKKEKNDRVKIGERSDQFRRDLEIMRKIIFTRSKTINCKGRARKQKLKNNKELQYFESAVLAFLLAMRMSSQNDPEQKR